VSEAAVELALRDLGRQVAWPPTPDLAASVRAELDRGAEVRTLRRRPVRRAVVLAAAALLVVLGGMVALSPGIRAAILRFFSLPGVRIEVEESSPPPSGPPTMTPGTDVQPFLGRLVSLGEARGEVGFPVAVPASLGRPDEVYVLGGGSRALVTLAYREREGVPADPQTGYAALLTQLRGRPTEDLVKKVELESPVVAVTVRGERGYWVEGPHLVYVQAPGGALADEPRIAGNTLLWTRGQVTLRLEVDLPLGEALELGRSVV
jgi:hypothetical protein